MNTPVSFELAKLLKEKGFNLYCKYSYWENELTNHTPGYPLEDGTTSQKNYWDFERYYAPTIAEVVMWLYEKHDILVQPTICNDKTFRVGCIELKNHPLVEHIVRNKNEQLYFNSLTEAYEAAITYVLTKLI